MKLRAALFPIQEKPHLQENKVKDMEMQEKRQKLYTHIHAHTCAHISLLKQFWDLWTQLVIGGQLPFLVTRAGKFLFLKLTQVEFHHLYPESLICGTLSIPSSLHLSFGYLICSQDFNFTWILTSILYSMPHLFSELQPVIFLQEFLL